MGGGGGSYFGERKKPSELADELRKAQAESVDAAFEADVASLLSGLLAQYNGRDTEAISRHLETISAALATDIEGTVDLRFGGSVAKHTHVDGLSDIDSLVVLNNSELQNLTPEQVKEYFVSRLQQRFSNTPIKAGKLAVTLSFNDMEVQLLPAIKYRAGYRIPDWTGKEWSYIRPKEFAEALTNVNAAQGGKVVSTVKLAKAIIASLPESRRLSGYHIESLAVQIFREYKGAKTPKAMLNHFFEQAPSFVRKPITDVTGQSTHVDAYLGGDGSLQRQLVSDSLGRISRKMKNADASQELLQWKDIFGE